MRWASSTVSKGLRPPYPGQRFILQRKAAGSSRNVGNIRLLMTFKVRGVSLEDVSKVKSRRRMREWMYRSTFFLISAQVGGKRSASRPSRFTSGERTPGTHCTRGWVDPRNGLEDVENTLQPTGTRTPSMHNRVTADLQSPITDNILHVHTWTPHVSRTPELCVCHEQHRTFLTLQLSYILAR
jgi:hypothetical protein